MKKQKKHGQSCGPWRKGKLLGKGGNADVWEAEDKEQRCVALKVLKNRHRDSEPYRRFVNEVIIGRKLKDQKGILPVIADSQPERTDASLPAWLAMPIALPIHKGLKNANPETVVLAITEIAETLASLAAQGIHHRDIKPDNLYLHDGKWVVGDFGLVSFPEKEELTEAGKKLGPMFYIAPEMLSNPHTADGNRADVYSLSKTLWVLASGQNYPLPGEQRADVKSLTLSAWTSHERAYLLDSLLERCTRTEPERRPKMEDVARELRTWLTPTEFAELPKDLRGYASRIGRIVQPKIRQREMRERLSRKAAVDGDRLADIVDETIRTLGSTVRSVIPGEIVYNDSMGLLGVVEEEIAVIEGQNFRHGGYIYRRGKMLKASDGIVTLFSGIQVAISRDDELTLIAAHIVAPHIEISSNTLSMGDKEIYFERRKMRLVWYKRTTRIPLRSALENEAIGELTAGLSNTLADAIGRFTQTLEIVSELDPSSLQELIQKEVLGQR
jgi:serine/threonine protein kinase